MHRQELAYQLRIAAHRVWLQIPLGVRFKIAVHRMLAQIHKGVGEAIVQILADHGFHVPRDAKGRVDLKDPEVANLGSLIYQKIRGVVRREADVNDVLHDTFAKVFLEKKTFLKLTGDSLSDYRGWILTVFHNAARSFMRAQGRGPQQVDVADKPEHGQKPGKDQMDRHRMLEMVESQLREQQRVPWERHPMWRQIKKDVYRALGEFDRQEAANRPHGKAYDFPTKRVFELMVIDGLSAAKAAQRLVEEGRMEADPSQLRHALKRMKNRLDKVVQTVVSSIEDRELLESFFDAIAA